MLHAPCSREADLRSHKGAHHLVHDLKACRDGLGWGVRIAQHSESALFRKCAHSGRLPSDHLLVVIPELSPGSFQAAGKNAVLVAVAVQA